MIKEVAKYILLIILLTVIMLAVYYFPVFDRLVFRPCHYYPQAFADCK